MAFRHYLINCIPSSRPNIQNLNKNAVYKIILQPVNNNSFKYTQLELKSSSKSEPKRSGPKIFLPADGNMRMWLILSALCTRSFLCEQRWSKNNWMSSFAHLQPIYSWTKQPCMIYNFAEFFIGICAQIWIYELQKDFN